MRALTANAVRIHLQYDLYMLDPWTVEPRAFDALERLVDIAEKNHIYLIITGLGAYRQEDSPPWYDSLSVEERWNTQALFWKTVAARVGSRTGVFAYDLINEPVFSVCDTSKPCSWLVGEPIAGYHFIQNISLEPDQNPDETMASWIHRLATAIRSEDSSTLITVGVLPNKPLAFYSEHLDFVSPHIYPRTETMQTLIDYVMCGAESKPLVVEEFFNLHCSPEELDTFLSAISGSYHGLFGHYQGQTLHEMTAQGDEDALKQRDFLIFFMANNPNRPQAPRTGS